MTNGMQTGSGLKKKTILSLLWIFIAALFCSAAAWGEDRPWPAKERHLLRDVNAARAHAGLPPLAWDEGLARAARKHARLMAERGRLSHRFAGEQEPSRRAASEGVCFTIFGENVARADDFTTVHTGLMRSPPHRANILNREFDSLGIGVYRRQDSSWWVAQEFARIPRPCARPFVKTVPKSLKQSSARLPLSFEAHEGRTDERITFLVRGNGYRLLLTSTEAVLILRGEDGGTTEATRHAPTADSGRSSGGIVPEHHIAHAPAKVLRMRLVGADPRTAVMGLEKTTGTSNYFIGNDPARWRRHVPQYGSVKYEKVYPGIDVIFHGRQGELEFDFVAAPGSDTGRIKLTFEGAEKIATDQRGDLILHVAGRELRLRKPSIYQEVDGIRREIPGGYAVEMNTEVTPATSGMVGFRVAAYDTTKQLVIDPVVVYSSFLGGSADERPFSGAGPGGIAIDAAGYVYIAGTTFSADFPTAGPLQGGLATGETCGYTGDTPLPCSDIFVAKLSPDGNGRIADRGCGNKKAAGTLGTDVFTDVLMK